MPLNPTLLPRSPLCLLCFVYATSSPLIALAQQSEPDGEYDSTNPSNTPVSAETAPVPAGTTLVSAEIAQATAPEQSVSPEASPQVALSAPSQEQDVNPELPESSPAQTLIEPAPAASEPAPSASVLDAPLEMKSGTNSSAGFLDFNLYPYMTDVDSDNVFTLNTFAKLPYGFSYFSLLNIGNQAGEAAFSDTTSFYTEQNLRFTPSAVVPIDLTLQYNMRSGDENDRLRLGFRWRLDNTPYLDVAFKAIHFAFSVNVHALQFDHEDDYVWQLEHVWRLSTPYLDNRLYFAGFIDHTFNGASPPDAPASPIVLEAQLGLRLIEEFYAIAEYRINQYRVGSETNLALGAEYVAKW